MKSSLALVAVSAVLALASPLERRRIFTKVDVKTVTNFVYPDGSPATHVPAVFYHHGVPEETETPEPTPTPTPTPVPEPVPEPQIELPEPDVLLDLAPVVDNIIPPAPEPEPAPAPVQEEAPYVGNDFISAALAAHNVNRAKHGVPALQWSEELASYSAQSAAGCVFEHNMGPGGGQYGQNIAMYGNSGGLPSEAEAINGAANEMWYKSERPLYKWFGSEPDMGSFHAWGHLTQVVWKQTTKVGCKVQRCPAGTLASYATYFTVCDYAPAGNFGGEFSGNVPPPTS